MIFLSTHCVWQKKKISVYRLLWLCELRPEPASANYAFSDLKQHTNTHNCELKSLFPSNHLPFPSPAVSPQLSLKHRDNHLLPYFEVTVELSKVIINWLSAQPLFEHLWSSTWLASVVLFTEWINLYTNFYWVSTLHQSL